jgi:tryptophanyl-tRNA synthetase
MKNILSGIQPSGKPHLGNYLGAMRQHIEAQKDNNCTILIVDLHALTTVRDREKMQRQTLDMACSYLALGLDPEKTNLVKQSSVSEHAELCWIFNCITKLPFIQRAHAFKDAKQKGKKEITAGLFIYPVLQAADILLYQPDLVPVGKDQKQHIEMTRDIATNFNNIFGETFKLPEVEIKEDVAVVPGVDGEKMSKSYGNTIDIFADDKTLKTQVMSIVTDSTPLEEAKDPDKCHVFALYKLIAAEEKIKEMRANYLAGGYGYGHAKKELLNTLLDYFGEAREKYRELSEKPETIKEILAEGSKRAEVKAKETLDLVKDRIGF